MSAAGGRTMIKRLRGDRGEITSVKVLFVLAVAAIVYFGWIYVPVYSDNYFGVRRAVRQACNIAYRSKSSDAVKDSFFKSIKELNMEDAHLGDDGAVTTSPVVFDEDNVDSVNISESPASITMEIHYNRTVVWPFLKKEKTVQFAQTHTEELSTIKY
jgi:hypothetical protein